MTRTLFTLIATIALFCLTSCNKDDDNYKITWVSETGTYNNSTPPNIVINTKEELNNYLQEYQIDKGYSIYKELDGNFSDYSIIAFSDCTNLKVQRIEYTEDNKSITVFCHTTQDITMPRPLCFFIKIKPKAPSYYKVNIVVDNT